MIFYIMSINLQHQQCDSISLPAYYTTATHFLWQKLAPNFKNLDTSKCVGYLWGLEEGENIIS